MSTEVLYLTANRREFTALTFELLIQNTNWSLVDRLVVYDDQSGDGARDEVSTRLHRVPVPSEIRDHSFGSPVAVMNDFIAHTECERFAKVDNDLALPPGWLEVFVGVMDEHPKLTLLGTESPFMGPPGPGWNGHYRYTPWKHIGGNGLMKTKFFKETGPIHVDGVHHGFTGHQWHHTPTLGWVTPDILVCLLDRCPIEPWKSLSAEYVKRGWQRRWTGGVIPAHFPMYFDWLPGAKEAS